MSRTPAALEAPARLSRLRRNGTGRHVNSVERRAFSPEYVRRAAHLLGILSHETRLRIVLQIAQGELTVSSLCELLDRPQSNVSHHLRILRDAALVQDRREGRYVYYELEISTWRALANGFFDKLLEGENAVRLQNVVVRRIEGTG